MKPILTVRNLVAEAKIFCEAMSAKNHSDLIGVTDRKAVGTYVDFESARQKIFGLGYNLLIFVYDKHDTANKCTLPAAARLFNYKQRPAMATAIFAGNFSE